MNRNKKMSDSGLPKIEIKRTGFPIKASFLDTFNAGELFPICDPIEIIPGDTFAVDLSAVVRMSTPQTPVMDSAFIDTYAFFVPYRLVWKHLKQFFGERDSSGWEPAASYEIPQMTLNSGDARLGSLAAHFGISPAFSAETGESVIGLYYKVNALPFRSYHSIYNRWFRSSHIQKPTEIPDTDNGQDNYGQLVAMKKVDKFHDMFTDALQDPQLGDAVTIPIGDIPVQTLANSTGRSGIPMRLYPVDSNWNDYGYGVSLGISSGIDGSRITTGQVTFLDDSRYNDPEQTGSSGGVNVEPENLWAIGSGALGGTIDDLRYAFAIQNRLTRQNIVGERYTEFIRGFFGVVSPDASLQDPQYLGGSRFAVGMTQVVQNSATDDVSPQGNVSGLSKTVDSSHMFTHSFTEHGFVILLGCLRTQQRYSRGLNKIWTKKDPLDFYDPSLAFIGYQPILKKELSFQWGTGNPDNPIDEQVFGYQEAFYDYRFMPSKAKNYFLSGHNRSLDIWHYGEDLQTPVLNSAFLEQGDEEIDRTLAVSEQTAGFQFFGDFYLDIYASRPMPLFSQPGLRSFF